MFVHNIFMLCILLLNVLINVSFNLTNIENLVSEIIKKYFSALLASLFKTNHACLKIIIIKGT